MTERPATARDPYAYNLSGVKHVWLVGVKVRHCEACGIQLPVIPRISQLHQVIARMLIEKPVRLQGDEVRFLRKQAGFPGNKFAALIGVRPETLSRVENGRVASLGKAADRLARVVSTITRDGEAAREMLLRVADLKLVAARGRRQGEGKVPEPVFRLKGKDWSRMAA